MSGKNILITGATSGIGQAVYQYYAEQGQLIYPCGRNQQKLAAYAEQHPHSKPLAFDITDRGQVAKASEQIGSIDLLILNAGDCEYIQDVSQFDGAAFARIININLASLGLLLEYFLPKVSAGGKVAFISSAATLMPFPQAEAYGASKAGVDYLANSLRVDLKSKNIGVVLVHPGFVKTPLTDKNTFAMPFLMTTEQAANRIVRGLNNNKDYIHFPKRLIWLLRLFSWLPAGIWQKLVVTGNEK